MDKTAERVHNQTIDFTNKVYEELSTITSRRKNLKYTNENEYDNRIDDYIDDMFILLDDIYYYCIQKKVTLDHNKQKVLDLEIHTPSPRKPKPEESVPKKPIKINNKSKKNNIKVEITDDKEPDDKEPYDKKPDDKEPDVLETIMYSSSDSSSDSSSEDSSYDKLSLEEELILAPNYKESDELVFLGLEEDGETEWYEQAKDLGMIHCSWCKKNLPKDDVYKVVTSHKSFTTMACENCIKKYHFVKIN